MKTFLPILFAFELTFFITSCKQQDHELTESQKTEIADSARIVVKKVFDLANNLDYKAGLQFYSGDPDTRYIDNGSIFPSLEAMKEAYNQVGPSMELVENKVSSWDAIVLAKDAVAFTLPIRLRVKAKGLPAYEGQYVWSGIVQKRNGRWMIIQSHESWQNYAEVIAALTPPADNLDSAN